MQKNFGGSQKDGKPGMRKEGRSRADGRERATIRAKEGAKYGEIDYICKMEDDRK